MSYSRASATVEMALVEERSFLVVDAHSKTIATRTLQTTHKVFCVKVVPMYVCMPRNRCVRLTSDVSGVTMSSIGIYLTIQVS